MPLVLLAGLLANQVVRCSLLKECDVCWEIAENAYNQKDEKHGEQHICKNVVSKCI